MTGFRRSRCAVQFASDFEKRVISARYCLYRMQQIFQELVDELSIVRIDSCDASMPSSKRTFEHASLGSVRCRITGTDFTRCRDTPMVWQNRAIPAIPSRECLQGPLFSYNPIATPRLAAAVDRSLVSEKLGEVASLHLPEHASEARGCVPRMEHGSFTKSPSQT